MTGAPIRFLLVDDVEDNLVALAALLRRKGLEILTARSGADALELLLVHEVALAFVDVQMPEMDGYELAELMRGAERTKSVPIIFVTAGARDPARAFKGYESGAVDFLFKPIDPRVLRSKADVFFELYRQRRELAEALRLNELFIGILGHDLRNPLAAILASASMLERQATDEAQTKTLRRMSSAGERMRAMIEQLLDLTRARLAGGLGFVRERAPLDVAALVKRAVEELAVNYPDRSIVVETRGDCTTAGDSERLLQLFSNLVANALHHGTEGREVGVVVECAERAIVVHVKNAGAIPADALPTLFDPFRSRQKKSAGSRGLGLGLFIAQQIALAHGGAIAVESDVAKHETVFTVTIPRSAAGESRLAHAGKRRRVLVIDDDENARESLRQAFEHEGYDAVTAATGSAAIEVLAGATKPDAVIFELVVPVMDGSCVVAALETNEALSTIPLITTNAQRAEGAKHVVLVPKPFDLDRLLERVATLWDDERPPDSWYAR